MTIGLLVGNGNSDGRFFMSEKQSCRLRLYTNTIVSSDVTPLAL